MSRSPAIPSLPLMILALGIALMLTGITLGMFGTGAYGIDRALQVTARFSFLLFWCAYAGSALANLFPGPLQILAQYRRAFGLSFASAHLAHIGLVVWLYAISSKPPVSEVTLIFFGSAAIWTYLLAWLSMPRLAPISNSTRRWLLLIGSEYISFAFLVDFSSRPLDYSPSSLAGYLPFVILSVGGTFARCAAWMSQFATLRNVRHEM